MKAAANRYLDVVVQGLALSLLVFLIILAIAYVVFSAPRGTASNSAVKQNMSSQIIWKWRN